MKTAFISHDDCILHDMGAYHPESPVRLQSILQHLRDTSLDKDVVMINAKPAASEYIERVHPAAHIHKIRALHPEEGMASIDPDTSLCPHSLRAADLAAGSIIQAVDGIMAGEYQRAFCAVRPPGHHAEIHTSMGFCVFNNIAIGVKHALQQTDINRIAILDFDVHHGNGTVDIFKGDPNVMVCSSFQHPFYPYRYTDIQQPNIVNTPLEAGTKSLAFRQAIERDWLPALDKHKPDFVFVSAGFDAHKDDPLAGLHLVEDDYRWITELICSLSDDYSQGRVASILEGGYDPQALARSVIAHIAAIKN